MGLQHAFAMVGGLITVPFVIFKFSVCFSCVELQQYGISAALITSGICSIIQILKAPIPMSEKFFGRKLFIGSGVLSVMGTSFTFLPIYEIAIRQMTGEGVDGRTAYGKLLGTSMLCGLLELVFSFLPLRWLKNIFPPLVTSITVMLIGVALTGTGMKYWGGGVVCAEMIWKDNSLIPEGTSLGVPTQTCDNGQVDLSYGRAEYVGLGFSVLSFLVVIELFGSVFLKYVWRHLVHGCSTQAGSHGPQELQRDPRLALRLHDCRNCRP